MFSDTSKKVLGYVYFPTDPNRVEKYVHLEKYFFGHGSIPNDQISFYAVLLHEYYGIFGLFGLYMALKLKQPYVEQSKSNLSLPSTT
jgi:hypothetical protein